VLGTLRRLRLELMRVREPSRLRERIRLMHETLATLARNRILPNTRDPVAFDLVTTPTPLQPRAFNLLGVNYRM
jgi:hypothetical protein